MEEFDPVPVRKRDPLTLSVDLRDVIGLAGAALVVGTAYTVHWAAAAATCGLGLMFLAWRLAK